MRRERSVKLKKAVINILLFAVIDHSAVVDPHHIYFLICADRGVLGADIVAPQKDDPEIGRSLHARNKAVYARDAGAPEFVLQRPAVHPGEERVYLFARPVSVISGGRAPVAQRVRPIYLLHKAMLLTVPDADSLAEHIAEGIIRRILPYAHMDAFVRLVAVHIELSGIIHIRALIQIAVRAAVKGDRVFAFRIEIETGNRFFGVLVLIIIQEKRFGFVCPVRIQIAV